MSDPNQTTIAKAKAKIEEKLRQAKAESTAMVQQARERSIETIKNAQNEAKVLINNTTFRNIFYVHNNIIHDVKPNGVITPFVPASFEAKAGNDYKKEMEKYSISMRNYKPYIEQVVKIKIPMPFGGSKVINTQVKRLPNPIPPPQKPVMPRDKEQKLNAAVADIIVDIHKTIPTIFWGRWAAPFQVFSMSLETKKINSLYECAKPVTSVALGPKTANPDKRHIYWMEGNEFIKRGTVDGSMPQEEYLNITAPDRGGLWQMEVDDINNHLYWTNDISLWRADIVDNIKTNPPENSSLMVISPSESPFPIDLAVDGYNGYLYWIDKELKKMRKSDLEGIHIQDLYDINKPTRGLKVDPNANLLYWSDEVETGHALRRADTQTEVVRLDGKDDFIQIPSFTTPADFTIEMWVNPDTNNDQQCFIGRHTNNGGNIFVLGYYKKNLLLNIKEKENVFGEKIIGHHHLAVVVKKIGPNKSQVSIYRNGEKLGDTKDYAASIDNWGDTPWFLGMDLDAKKLTDFFDGGISELRVWSGTKTEATIRTDRFNKLRGDEDNLLGLWRADERQGSILPDLTKAGNFATIFRDGKTFPKETNLLNLDGKTNSITIPPFEIPFENGLSIEVWAYFNKFGNWSRIIDFGNGMDTDNILLANAGGSNKLTIEVIEPGARGKTNYTFSSPILELKKWMHLAVTIEPSGKVRMYKNGQLVDETKPGKELKLPRTVLRTKNYIGQSNWSHDALFNGKLNDLRIWDCPLTREQIKSRMHKRLVGIEPGIVGYWPINEGSGELVHDRTVNALDGQISDPKKEVKQKIVAFEIDRLAVMQRITAEESKLSELQRIYALKKENVDDIKLRQAELTKLKSEEGKINSDSNAAQKELQTLKNDAAALSHKRTMLHQQMVKLDVQMAQLNMAKQMQAAQSMFGNKSGLNKVNAQIKQNRSQHQKVGVSINQVNQLLQSVEGRMGQTQGSLSALAVQKHALINRTNAIQAEIIAKEQQVISLDRNIAGQTFTIFKTQIKNFKDELLALDAKLEPLQKEFSDKIEGLWEPEQSPVNNVVEKEFEVETVVNIPGMDGLELVYAEEYAKVKRKKAIEELHRTREKGAREKAQAEALAAAKVQEGYTLKRAKQKEADQKEAEATRIVEQKRKQALAEKTAAEESKRKSIAEAQKNKDNKINQANSSATNTKTQAQADADRRLREAQNKKNAAQSEKNKAAAEKRKSMG